MLKKKSSNMNEKSRFALKREPALIVPIKEPDLRIGSFKNDPSLEHSAAENRWVWRGP